MSFVPGGPDVALQALSTGKLDLIIDAAGPNQGNVRFDGNRTASLFSRIVMRKGSYYWDQAGTEGTALLSIKDDRAGTPSKLSAAVTDGCEQVKALQYLTTYQVSVSKPRFANYQITVAWTVPGQRQPSAATTQSLTT